MQLSRVLAMALIVASQLIVASPVPDNLPGKQYNGELECEHLEIHKGYSSSDLSLPSSD